MKQPTWSDAELLHHDFDILGRPDGDPTLTTAKPPEGARFRCLRGYNITPPRGIPNPKKVQPYVWCALCQEATHWKGWEAEIIDDPAQTRFLVGQVCARRNGGPALVAAANQFDAQRARAETLRAREAVLGVAGYVRRALADWGTAAGVAAVGAWRGRLSTAAPAHYPLLEKTAASSPPVLLLEVEVRDTAEEDARLWRRPNSERIPLYRTEYKQAGRVAGRALYAGSSPAGRITRLLEKFDAAIAALRLPTDGIHTRTVRAPLLEIRAVADRARELEQEFAQYAKGLEDAALDIVFAWFNALPNRGLPATFTRRGRELIVTTWERIESRTAIPDAVPITRPPELDALEMALLGRIA